MPLWKGTDSLLSFQIRRTPHQYDTVQITPTSVPSTPTFLGEVAVFAQVFSHLGLLNAIQEQVRFARARFGTSDTIDFVVALIGYALSGESTLKAFYERLMPFAKIFMALLAATDCRIVQRSLGFLPPLIKLLWKPYEPCFWRI